MQIPVAALYQANTRLLVALVLFVLFVAVLPRPNPRPLAAAVVGAIVVVWDFGATLIWGTGGSTKVRFDFALAGTAGGWVVLVAVVVGIISGAAALRAFADQRRRFGTLLGGGFVLAFAFWSSAVRYSPIVALIGLLAATAAFWWAAAPREQTSVKVADPRPASQSLPVRLPVALGTVLPFLSGFLFYACLQWGPKTWDDPQCGATLFIPAFIAAVGIPAIAVGLSTWAAGKRTEAILAATLITVLAAAGICALAFVCWFGQNLCGE
jgi:hypothetical protein